MVDLIEKAIKEFYSEFEAKLSEMGVAVLKEEEVERFKPKIGKGSFGKVYKGKYQSEMVAIKKIMLKDEFYDKGVLDEILKEIQCVKMVQNECVPKFYGIWKRKRNFHLVFEFINGKPLSERYKDLSVKQKLEVIYQLSNILCTIHKIHMIHRDIKPANIMVDDSGKIKLIDFGVSKIAEKTNTYTNTTMGTTRYMAPDNFQIDKVNPINIIHINHKIDIWSTGCLISEIFSGLLPWTHIKSDLILRKKLSEKTEFPIPETSISFGGIVDVIQKCLAVNPDNRISAEELMKLVKEKIDNL